MNYLTYLPVWSRLDKAHQAVLEAAAFPRKFKRGEILHNGSADCTGLILVLAGQLRAYMTSEDGREITLYRLLERDFCLFSASCMLHSMQFDITIAAEKDTEVLVLPAEVYKSVMEESALLANYTNEVMASRFSDVMWLMDQVLWKSFDRRLADFLQTEATLEGTQVLKLTHEAVGNHLGSPREVVTRMLKYFVGEGMVSLSRGTITITDGQALSRLAKR